MIRVSSFATVSDHRDVEAITTSLIDQKAVDASINARLREIHMFHSDVQDPVQRMLNALQPSTYARPHRHINPPKPETLLLLKGALGFVSFSDDGVAEDSDLVLVGPKTETVGVDCRAGVWHTFFALEPDTVVFEVKAGPFEASTDKESAIWAPPEGTPEGTRYLADLEDRFRRHFQLGPRPQRT